MGALWSDPSIVISDLEPAITLKATSVSKMTLRSVVHDVACIRAILDWNYLYKNFKF